MKDFIVFDEQLWLECPEHYPMVFDYSLSPVIKHYPVLRLGGTRINDGSVLIQRNEKEWFAIPGDVFAQILERVK